MPSSARALHLKVDHYMSSKGFKKVGFEDSVWVREAGGEFKHCILFSAHIDDCLIICENLDTLNKFKKQYLTRFDGTDEGEVTRYLGCQLQRDSQLGPGQILQTGYAEKVLRTYGLWETTPVVTPLKPGVRLSKKDCPDYMDPKVHR